MPKVEINCEDCGWSEEVEVSEMEPRCPECGGRIERSSEPKNPTNTRSDKVLSLIHI